MRLWITLLLTGLSLSSFVRADVSSQDLAQAMLRAANQKAAMLVAEIHRLKGDSTIQNPFNRTITPASVPNCNPSPTCVADCTTRYSDGSCGSYGPDYCGPEASCAVDCTDRYSDGTCGDYAADYCGPDASCTPDCTVRYSDGSCGDYGPDVCY